MPVLNGENFDRERAENMYRAAVTLYGEDEWAQGVLKSARAALDAKIAETGVDAEKPDGSRENAAEEKGGEPGEGNDALSDAASESAGDADASGSSEPSGETEPSDEAGPSDETSAQTE